MDRFLVWFLLAFVIVMCPLCAPSPIFNLAEGQNYNIKIGPGLKYTRIIDYYMRSGIHPHIPHIKNLNGFRGKVHNKKYLHLSGVLLNGTPFWSI